MRQKGRRRGIRRVRTYGQWWGQGPQVEDAESGFMFPKRLMVPQRGGLVSEKWADGSRDREPEY
jgi:hypothetical protein